ncbi:MAG: hypothetical protein ACXQS6_04200 [Candidatus Syntropharchaeales archaeon]
MENKKTIKAFIDEVWYKLTSDGRSDVRDHNKPLRSVNLKEQSDPEAFTRYFLIEKILDLLNLEILPEKQFRTVKAKRKVDYRVKNQDQMFLIEAKPINVDLYEKDEEGNMGFK